MQLIHTILPELLAIVFDYCPDPHVLSSVCARWYSLVTLNPTLWSHIHAEPTASALARAQISLARSQNVPIHVTISSSNDKECDLIPALVDLFVPHLARIQTFCSRLGGHVVPALFPPGALVSMPLLEHLTLRIDDARSHSLVTAFLDSTLGLLHAPRLASLTVSDCTPIADALVSVLPQLRSLDVLDARIWAHSRSFPALLARCTNIESCSIVFPANCFFRSPVTPIALPELKSLALEWPFLFEPAPVFRALSAPKLESLTLSHLTRQLILPPSTLAALRPLAQSAAPTLRTITLVGCNLSAQDECAALFQDCVALECLTLTNCHHVDMFLAPLTPAIPVDSDSTATTGDAVVDADDCSGVSKSTPTPWVCPRLAHVAIKGINDADVRPIVTFARSRSRVSSSSSVITTTIAGGASSCATPEHIPTATIDDSIPFIAQHPPPLSVSQSPPSAVPASHTAEHPHPHRQKPCACGPGAAAGHEPASGHRSSGGRPGTDEPACASYLEQLTLDVDITALSRNTRVLLLSGLYQVHRELSIVGRCGELFAGAADPDATAT